MAKLYFRYGAMNSGKTRDLLKTRYNYLEKGMKVVVIKPRRDVKGEDMIVPRGAEPIKVDYLVKDSDNIFDMISYHRTYHNIHCILVDEAQFLREKHIKEFTDIVDLFDIPVICYGLRVDFKGHLFPGSKALFECADSFEEMKTVCSCGRKATRNIRYVNGEPVFYGGQIAIAGENDVTYDSVCRKCERELRNKVKNNIDM